MLPAIKILTFINCYLLFQPISTRTQWTHSSSSFQCLATTSFWVRFSTSPALFTLFVVSLCFLCLSFFFFSLRIPLPPQSRHKLDGRQLSELSEGLLTAITRCVGIHVETHRPALLISRQMSLSLSPLFSISSTAENKFREGIERKESKQKGSGRGW